MYNKLIPDINKKIAETGRAIISLGCSFVQGQGAFNAEIYDTYKLKDIVLGANIELDINEQQRKDVLDKYKTVTRRLGGGLDFTYMEYDNAFTNVLCNKYFEGSYAPINLGLRGCGNRGTIKELYFNPDINWDGIKEAVVIYCPSGLERFDFINDFWMEHFHWKAMWPHYQDIAESPKRDLWRGYATGLWSNKFEVLEQIGHVQELLTWCKLKNAKLIITPGFDTRYTRDNFTNSLSEVIVRDMLDNQQSSNQTHVINEAMKMLDSWPWANMYEPEGYMTFADFVVSKEKVNPTEHYHFFQYFKTGSPNGWITPCAHPSAKGHDLFAENLFKHINSL
jgi:hypothetical protein